MYLSGYGSKFFLIVLILSSFLWSKNSEAQIIPSRTTGMVPLSVYFDQPGSYDHKYTWDFGDNTSTDGFQAAHIYETPGNYTVTLTQTNPKTNQSSTFTTVIRVLPFMGTTYYIDCAAGNDGLSGLTPNTALRSPEKIQQILVQEYGDNLRAGLTTWPQSNPSYFQFLIKRGSFCVLSGGSWLGWMPNATGISHVRFGAYGDPSQPKPIIKENYSRGLGSPEVAMVAQNGSIDVAFRDIVFEGNYTYVYANPQTIRGYSMYPTDAIHLINCYQFLFLRTEIRHTNFGMVFQGSEKQLTVKDSYIHHVNYSALHGGAEKYALLGNRIEYSSNGHNHYAQADNGVIRGNTFKNAGPQLNPGNSVWFTCNLRVEASRGRLLISNNKILEGSGSGFCMGHNNVLYNTKDVVLEKNTIDGWMPGGNIYWPEGSTVVMNSVENVLFRNNIVTNTRGGVVIGSQRNPSSGIIYPTKNVQVLNNTFYKSFYGSEPSSSTFVLLSTPLPGESDIKIKNNIFQGPINQSIILRQGAFDIPGLEIDNNLYSNASRFQIDDFWPNASAYPQFAEWQTHDFDRSSINGVAPQFVSEDPSNANFLKIYPSSPAANRADTTVPVFEDKFLVARPAGRPMDIGMFESP